MKLNEVYKHKRPVISFEIFPPKKDSELKDIDETLRILCSLQPDFISVTFGAGGSDNIDKTLALAEKIKKEYAIEPVVHLTCLHYTKAQIAQFAKQLKDAGIENVLALRGDRNPRFSEQHDFTYASQLIRYLKSDDVLCVGGACYPECHPEAESVLVDIQNLAKKVNAGADFLITQLFFDNSHFYTFLNNCKLANINIPISAGVMPVLNKAQIERMVDLCNASLPVSLEKILQRFEHDPVALFDAGMAYALHQVIDLLASDVDGIHIYTMNNPSVAKRICEGIANILKR